MFDKLKHSHEAQVIVLRFDSDIFPTPPLIYTITPVRSISLKFVTKFDNVTADTIQVAQLSQRDRAAGSVSFDKKWNTIISEPNATRDTCSSPLGQILKLQHCKIARCDIPQTL